MNRRSVLIAATLLLGLAVTGFSHAWNMFRYPYYESDEGTYVSQAWSLVNEGELSPYTYWYDHPPLGFITIASWVQAQGGDFFRFGTSVDTVRVFMLVVALASAALVYLIVYRATDNPAAALLGVVLFSLSPVAIYFHRRVLLDNLLTFWILASSAVLFSPRIRLRHYIFSAVFFALAVLTKVTSVMFGLPILLLALSVGRAIPRAFRGIVWLTVAGLGVSIFFLYAAMRGELFPAPAGEHVSLIESTLFQMSRHGTDYPFWDLSSDFGRGILDWMNKDQVAVSAAAIILALGAIHALWNRHLRFLVAAALFYLYFLARGGIVLNFYVIPIIPFVAMAGAVLTHDIASFFSRREGIRAILIVFPLAAVVTYYAAFGPTKQYVRDETSQQKHAIHWIKEHLGNEDAIIVDASMLVELRDPDYYNGKDFPNADWFYKVNRDPAIRDAKYGGDWRNFDYIALTHEMLRQIDTDPSPTVKLAYRNSLPVAKWLGHRDTFVDERHFNTTNGDWAMVFRVNDEHHARLLDSWEHYKETYMILDGENYGQVVDPSNGVTTSEGQSYAMLRAAWMNDQHAFIAAWLWAHNHLQHRVDDRLFSWQWKDGALGDSTNATDADEDIALALLFGYRLWNDETYLVEARAIIDDLWENCVVKINGRYHFLPMHEEDADKWTGYLFNPSYLSPASYRIFAEVDPKHDWEALADDSYEVLDVLGSLSGNKTGLPSDWIFLDKKYGGFYTAAPYFEREVDDFSFDAFRTFWRVSLDEQWFQTPAARKYLETVAGPLSERYAKQGYLPMTLSTDGRRQSTGRSLSTDSGYAVALRYGDDSLLAQRFVSEHVDAAYDESRRAWGATDSYYDANWAWLGTAAYHGSLRNIWELNVFDGS